MSPAHFSTCTSINPANRALDDSNGDYAVGDGSTVVETRELGRRMVRELEGFLSQALRRAAVISRPQEPSIAREVEPC